MAHREERPSHQDSSTPWAMWLLLIGAAVVLLVARQWRGGPDDYLLNRPLPPLEVAGWINADASPTPASLRGQVVLIDFWATWCVYCVEEMPELVKLYQRFQDQGLVVIGLTPEMAGEVPQVKSYVASVEGMTWPVGYGAMITLDIMGVDAFPTLVLFDRSGQSVWTGASIHGLEEAVVKALAEEPVESQETRVESQKQTRE